MNQQETQFWKKEEKKERKKRKETEKEKEKENRNGAQLVLQFNSSIM